jgi:hypothetical protein
MKFRQANISIVLLISLVVILSGATIVVLGINSKYNAKVSYERIENRYIAESGIDLSVGLFLNYLSNQDFVLSYTKNEDGSYSVIDDYSPYLLPEISFMENRDNVALNLIENESKAYLVSIGFLDFMRDNGIEVSINTFNNKDNFKLSRMCIAHDFLISNDLGAGNACQSKINPIFLTVKSKYKGGEVLCNVEIANINVVRDPFEEIEIGEQASIKAHIDINSHKISYNNYQNYRGLAK